MALSATKLFEIQTRNPAIVVEVHTYTKLAADTTGTVTRSKGRKIRRILGNSDGTAAIAASGISVNLSGLATSSTHSLNGMVAIEVERI